MASQHPNPKSPISLLLYRTICILITLVSLIYGILMGVLPPYRIDEYGWGPVGPQLPYLSITFLAIILILDIEELTRLLIRQTKKRWEWQTYPGFVIGCDFVAGLAVFLITWCWNGRKFSGHRSDELRALQYIHEPMAWTCGAIHIVWSVAGVFLRCRSARRKSKEGEK